MKNKDALLSGFRNSVAQMLNEHQNVLYDRLNQTEAPNMFVHGQQMDELKMEMAERMADIVEAITAIAEEIANIKAKKQPEPKDIKLVYKGKKLNKAILTKDDGTTVEVEVGRNK